MGVGATIDYEADAVKRAPRWMTRNGLEWVYRITTEPRRYWRRYLRDIDSSGSSCSTVSACIARRCSVTPIPNATRDASMIRTAMVGLGKMGLSHLAIVRAHPSIDLVAGCDATAYLTDILTKHAGAEVLCRSRPHARERAARRAGRRDAVEAACGDGREGA